MHFYCYRMATNVSSLTKVKFYNPPKNKLQATISQNFSKLGMFLQKFYIKIFILIRVIKKYFEDDLLG